jgi:hypothetical protein
MAVNIQAHNWSDVNLLEITQLVNKAGFSAPFWNPDLILDWVHQFLEQAIERFSSSFVILARTGKDLVGMTSVITSDPSRYELWRWHPVVLPAQNEAEIATGLIQASITHMKAASAHWLEVCFDFSGAGMTPELKSYYHKYKSW